MNLRQGTILVNKYCLKFIQLDKYSQELLPDSRARTSKFVNGVYDLVVKKFMTTMFIWDMDGARLMIHAYQIEAKKLNKGERMNMRARVRQLKYGQHKFGEGNISEFHNHSSLPTPSSTNNPTCKSKQQYQSREPSTGLRLVSLEKELIHRIESMVTIIRVSA